jgi:Zn-dependent protease with chaperone function
MMLLGLLVSVAAVALMTCTVVAGVVSLLARSTWLQAALLRRSSVAAVVTALPASAGLLAVLALMAPNLIEACHCVEHGLHHPHLCFLHPALSAPLVVPALVVLAVASLRALPRLFALTKAALRSRRLARAARSVEPTWVDQVGVRLLDLGQPQAFSLGALRPVIIADRALWAALSEEERRAIAHHEQGHIERRDGLTLLMLSALLAMSVLPVGGALVERWKRAAERACDRHAAHATNDGALVAQALVSVERARARHAASLTAPELALGAVACTGLEDRVTHLLAGRASEEALVNDLLGLVILFAGAAVLTVAWPGSFFHHLVETMLGLTLH